MDTRQDSATKLGLQPDGSYLYEKWEGSGHTRRKAVKRLSAKQYQAIQARGNRPSQSLYVTKPQCITVYVKGWNAGKRCPWHAVPGGLHCKRHTQTKFAHLNDPDLREKSRVGASQAMKNWWARLKAIEAQHPGTIRKALNLEQAVRTRELQRKLMPKPATKDKIVQRAHKTLVQRAATLNVPDKPFEEMTTSEQFAANTRKSIVEIHKILHIPYETKNEDGTFTVDLKAASLVKDTAQRTIATAVKIDHNTLQAKRIDRMADILERLKGKDEPKTIDVQSSSYSISNSNP